MPQFLTQVAYTDQAWQSLVSNPQNRFEALRPVFEKLGGRIINVWFAFGDYDVVLISELPDNVSAAALAIAASAGGACKSIKTTPLMDASEGVEAMKMAAAPGYRPPQAADPRQRKLSSSATVLFHRRIEGILTLPGCPFASMHGSQM